MYMLFFAVLLIFLLLFGQRSSVMHTLSFQREDVKKKCENLKQNPEPLWQYMYYMYVSDIHHTMCSNTETQAKQQKIEVGGGPNDL